MQKKALISIGYDVKFLAPLSKVSAIMDMLSDAEPVYTSWHDGNDYFIRSDVPVVSVTSFDKPVITAAELEAIRNK